MIFQREVFLKKDRIEMEE